MRIYYDNRFKHITLQYGVACLESFCPCAHKCKMRNSYRWHNFCVRVENFFKYRLHIPLVIPFYRIYSHHAMLSGTPLCPYKLPRHYDCHGCYYGFGEYELCRCKERKNDIINHQMKEPEAGQYCAYIKTLPWDINTGDIIWRDEEHCVVVDEIS